jgi:hypothetical protein
MPRLPSGRQLAISHANFIAPGTHCFACPEKHFWYQTPDLAINPPPYGPLEGDIIMDFAHAPVPETREEAARYVIVLFERSEDRYYWPGHWLGDFERPEDWSDRDWKSWQEWLSTPRVQDYLDRVIGKCRAQSEENAGGRMPAFRAIPQSEKERTKVQGFAERCRVLEREIADLPPSLADASLREDQDNMSELHSRVRPLADRVDALLIESKGRLPFVWHARGLAHHALREWGDAERCFLEALRRAPFAFASWVELSVCRGQLGKYEEAEEAARRALEASREKSPEAWRLLAAALLSQERVEEATVAFAEASKIEAPWSCEGDGAERGDWPPTGA